MVSKFDDEVDIFESVVDIASARDESEESDSEQFVSQKQVENVDTSKDSRIAPVVNKHVESPEDDYEDFLNDDECDNSVKSLHTDYETL
jgi:hypothetical protein